MLDRLLYLLLLAIVAYFFVYPALNPEETKDRQPVAAQRQPDRFNVQARFNAVSGELDKYSTRRGSRYYPPTPVAGRPASPMTIPGPLQAQKEFNRVHDAMGIAPRTAAPGKPGSPASLPDPAELQRQLKRIRDELGGSTATPPRP